MFVKEVKVRYGQTINLGNFETVRIVMEETAQVTDNNPDEVIEAVFQELKTKVENKAAHIKHRAPAS